MAACFLKRTVGPMAAFTVCWNNASMWEHLKFQAPDLDFRVWIWRSYLELRPPSWDAQLAVWWQAADVRNLGRQKVPRGGMRYYQRRRQHSDPTSGPESHARVTRVTANVGANTTRQDRGHCLISFSSELFRTVSNYPKEPKSTSKRFRTVQGS